MRTRSSDELACVHIRVHTVYRRIKYNQTRQTRVMNQIISDRGAVEGGIIYPREKDKSA